MNIEEKIKAAIAQRDDLQQQMRDVEKQSAMLQQRYQALTFTHARAEGALSALQEMQKEMEATAEAVKE